MGPEGTVAGSPPARGQAYWACTSKQANHPSNAVAHMLCSRHGAPRHAQSAQRYALLLAMQHLVQNVWEPLCEVAFVQGPS